MSLPSINLFLCHVVGLPKATTAALAFLLASYEL